MKELNEKIDDVVFWVLMSLAALGIFALLGVWMFTGGIPGIIMSLAFIIVLRRELWGYVVGIVTLNREALPGSSFKMF